MGRPDGDVDFRKWLSDRRPKCPGRPQRLCAFERVTDFEKMNRTLLRLPQALLPIQPRRGLVPRSTLTPGTKREIWPIPKEKKSPNTETTTNLAPGGQGI